MPITEGARAMKQRDGTSLEGSIVGKTNKRQDSRYATCSMMLVDMVVLQVSNYQSGFLKSPNKNTMSRLVNASVNGHEEVRWRARHLEVVRCLHPTEAVADRRQAELVLAQNRLLPTRGAGSARRTTSPSSATSSSPTRGFFRPATRWSRPSPSGCGCGIFRSATTRSTRLAPTSR